MNEITYKMNDYIKILNIVKANAADRSQSLFDVSGTVGEFQSIDYDTLTQDIIAKNRLDVISINPDDMDGHTLGFLLNFIVIQNYELVQHKRVEDELLLPTLIFNPKR